MNVERAPDAVAHVATVGVVVVWAGSFTAIKALLDHGVAAEDIAIIRYAVAAPGFAFLLWRVGGLPRLGRRDAVRVVAAGILVVVGYHLSLNIGERWTTAGTAALVVALAPGMTLALAVAVGLERLSARRTLGLAVAFAGVFVVVVLGSGQAVSLEGVRGPLIVLGAPLSFALYNVILKPLFARYGVLALTAATSLVGTLGLLPLADAATAGRLVASSPAEAALLLYLGVVCTLVGYVGWNIGLRGLGPSRAVAYAYVIPPLAVAIGAVTLDEPLSVWLVAGGALVVGGVALAQGARRPREDRRTAPAPTVSGR